jgi:hypothetical protein
MKIVIIGQWVYPEQKPRSQRAWQLGLRLAKDGHDVTLYALLGSTYDYSQVEKEYGLKVRNLGVSWNGLTDSEGHRKKHLVSGVIKNLLDEYDVFPGRDFYPMVRKALKKEGEIDLLVSIASPHAIHWAVARCIDRSKVKTWIADSGDPFMLNPFMKHHSCLEKQERLWCERCDYITVPIEEARKSYYPEYAGKIRVIPQGFDFQEIALPPYEKNDIPAFIFAGRAYENLRDPGSFLRYLSKCGRDYSFVVYTSSPDLFNSVPIPGKMSVKGYIPRKELLPKLAMADFLINITNPSTVQSPSKLIDYALSGRPILDISSSFTEEERDRFERFLNGDYTMAHRIENLDRYEIRNVAEAFISLARR